MSTTGSLRRFSPLLLLVTFGLLFVVLVPGLGVHAMGSSRWVGFGQFRLQPSELMKLALTLFAADFIARRLDEDATDRRIIGPLILVTGFASVLILAQPDMGTAMVLGVIALALLFVSGVRLGPVMKVMAALFVLALIVAVASPYRRARLLSFMDPSAHSSGSGYQVMQSLIGLGSGHLYGAGLGGGQAQWGYLPNAHTDFIFSVIGEELGIVGAVLVLALLGGFLWLGIRAATQSVDRFGALLALGLVAWVGGRDPDQRGSGGRRAAGHRDPAAVHLVRGLVPRDHDGRGRRARQRRPAGRGRPGAARRPRRPSRPRRRPGSVSARRGTVVAGGGTGGHIVPSLQIARALVERGHAARDDRAVRLAPGAGGPPVADPRVPLHAPARARAPAQPAARGAGGTTSAPCVGIVWACARALGSFVARRPRVVVIVGGYASFPAGLAAVLTRVPLVSVNTDAVPGAVNGLLGRFAAANAVAFAGTDLPRAHVTGTPVRPELASLDRTPEGRARGRAALGLPPDRQTIAAVGGSLGALRINRAVSELARSWADCGGRTLYHVTGRRDYEAFAPARAALHG